MVEKNLTERLSKIPYFNFQSCAWIWILFLLFYYCICREFITTIFANHSHHFLDEAQSQLLTAQEKERLASRNVSELSSRITRLESQVNSYRTERARLEAELEIERTKVGSLEDTNSRLEKTYLFKSYITANWNHYWLSTSPSVSTVVIYEEHFFQQRGGQVRRCD